MKSVSRLNKRNEYKLPSEVTVTAIDLEKNKDIINKIEPDVCLQYIGDIKVCDKMSSNKQIWIKSSNKELIDFIKTYNWENEGTGITYKTMHLLNLKRIILERFYKIHSPCVKN